ncbi:MAG: hypothetical protein HY860_04215 [Chlamydiales bacterium]|nr:hypothetical protein [Chlamydiales bacterium]
MSIYNLPPYGSGQYPSFSEKDALVQISRNADGLINEIDKMQTYLDAHQNGDISDRKFHASLNTVVQHFSDFIVSVQQLVIENPAYTEQLIAAKEAYNVLLQPVVVENYNHAPNASQLGALQHSLGQIKQTLNDIVGQF